jgi:hypothetical protein
VNEPRKQSKAWTVCLPLLLFFVTVVVGLKFMPKTGATPRQDHDAPALGQMPEMTVAAYKVQPPSGGAWLPGVQGRLDDSASGDYKVFLRDGKSFGGVVARVSPDTEEGRQVYEILKDGNWRLITIAVRQDPKRSKMWWEIVEPLPVIRIVGVKKSGA